MPANYARSWKCAGEDCGLATALGEEDKWQGDREEECEERVLEESALGIIAQERRAQAGALQASPLGWQGVHLSCYVWAALRSHNI